MDKLTTKQQRFVEEYLVDHNATQAAIRAGYKPNAAKETGYENLTKPHILTAVRAGLDKLAEKAEVSAEKVVDELAALGFSSMGNYLAFTADGRIHLNFNDLTAAMKAAIMEVTQEEYDVKTRDGFRTVIKTRIKLHPKHAALESLGKYLGLFTDKAELSGSMTQNIDLSRLTDAQLGIIGGVLDRHKR